MEPLSGGVKYMGCENFANITLYLGNGTRQTHSYNEILTESHVWPIDMCRFQ